MKERINIFKANPKAYQAVMGMENYLATTSLTPIHKELIKMRASQINGCAFCLDMHAFDAKKYGETDQRLFTLNAWRDTSFFTEEEQAILALTEEVTLISNHVSDATYEKAAALFDEIYLSEIILAIITINAWNRIAITTHMQPALRK